MATLALPLRGTIRFLRQMRRIKLLSDSTLSRLEATDGRIETLLKALTILYAADLICHLWQQYVNVALFPLGNSSVAIRREMTVFNSQTVSRIEGAANQVIQRVIDGMLSYATASSGLMLLQVSLHGWRHSS
jgi:hypothetical protein